MNALVGELKNPFVGGKVIGANIRYDDYARQTAQRGQSDYILGRGDLMEFDRCPHRWLVGYESEDTKFTEWGEMIDCLALTPQFWKTDFAVTPETYPDAKTGEQKPWNWNANFCKEWREEHKALKIRKADDLRFSAPDVSRLKNARTG